MKNQKIITDSKISGNIFFDKHWPFLWIFIIGLMLYGRTLNFGFSPLDESNLILERIEWYKDVSNLPSLFSKGVFNNKNMGEQYYRPVLMLTFMTDTLIGNGSPKVYHLTNIILHIIASILCFLFFTRLLQSRRNAFLITLVFLVHPVFTHAVAWIPGRNDTLMAIFSLACFIFFIDYLKYKKWHQLVLHYVFLFLCLLTKESAFVIILVLAIYYWLFSEKKSCHCVSFYLLSWLMVGVAWVILKNSVIKTEVNFALFDYKKIFIDASQALFIYIGKIFFPFNQAVLPTVKGTTIIIGVLVTIGLGFIILKYKVSGYRKVIFGLAWFILFLGIPLLLATFDGMGLHYEHRMYVPMIGFLLFLSCLNIKIPNLTSWLVILIILFFIKTILRFQVYRDSMSFTNAAVEESPNLPMSYNLRGAEFRKRNRLDLAEADFSSALKIDSLYLYSLFNLGALYNEQGKPGMALKVLNRGLKKDSLNVGALYARGNTYFDLNDFRYAISDYSKCIVLYPQYSKAYNNRGNSYSNLRQFDKAIADYNNAILKDPKNAVAYSNRSNAYLETGKYTDALNDIENAIMLNSSPELVAAKNHILAVMQNENAGEKIEVSFIEQQLLPKALEYFRNKHYQEALFIFQKLKTAADKAGMKKNKISHMNNIGLCFMKMNMPQEAEQEFTKIILLDPKYERAYSNLGLLNKLRGNFKMSMLFYKSAQRINPGNSQYAAEIANLERMSAN